MEDEATRKRRLARWKRMLLHNLREGRAEEERERAARATAAPPQKPPKRGVS